MKTNKILLTIMLGIFLISLVSAYSPHKQNTDWNVGVSSNNATSCNVSYISYPDNSMVYLKGIMTQDRASFNYSLDSGNFTQLGDTCAGIVCTDGVKKEVGSICRNVTPSGFINTLGLYLIFLIVLGGVIILGFSIEEVWFVVLGGMGLIMLGIYSINYGIVGFKDMFMTWGVGLFLIGIGTILSIGAAWQKMDYD